MNRRSFLESALIVGALTFASGHTPYRQWKIYRKRYLLILTSKTDVPSYPLGKRVAEVLATYLPASKARVTRAPYTRRIGSLISSKQMDVALLSRNDAVALLMGRPPFVNHGPLPLRTIIGLGGYLLICRDDFPARHAYLIAETLSTNRDAFSVAVFPAKDGPSDPDATVPVHQGALAYYEGRLPPNDKAEEQ